MRRNGRGKHKSWPKNAQLFTVAEAVEGEVLEAEVVHEQEQEGEVDQEMEAEQQEAEDPQPWRNHSCTLKRNKHTATLLQ